MASARATLKITNIWPGLQVVGMLPAVLLGLFLEKQLRQLFGEPVVAAAFLVINGGLLFLG